MMGEDENSWVFDSLVCFLNGPIWDAPIQNFIEEKSLIFEPDSNEHGESYRKVFDEYKNLVDFMLGNFMEDIGITSAQFEYACFKSQQRHSVRFEQNTFEQIWAANNFEMFKRMMTQKNVELQLQALELIEQKYGIMPQSFIPKKKSNANNAESSKTEVQEQTDAKKEIEMAILSEVAKKFPEEEPTDAPEIEALLEEKQILENTRDKISTEISKTEEEILSSVFEQQIDEKNEDIHISKVESNEDNSKEETSSSQNPTVEHTIVNSSPSSVMKPASEDVKPAGIKQIDQLELKKRQEYLRMQRDKLVALKTEERRKQFGKAENQSDAKKSRPKSAKAAEVVLTGEKSAIPPQQLQFRRALAERLKLEVVDKNKN